MFDKIRFEKEGDFKSHPAKEYAIKAFLHSME